ncbi:MAG: ubiquitin-like domain-containing protein [Bifidobacteriaceae bacterium]|jgi:uncharacterized protein YabE (DUF348 family)|nr:ubiquitin-like domain-containing protein [Bifidobacteriaceae bacterium]
MTRACGHAAPAPKRRRDVRRAAKRSRFARITAQVAVTLVAAGGLVGFGAAHKSVTLVVDGHATEVTTFSGSVGGVLAQQGVTVSDRDLVAPGLDAAVPRDGEIVVRTARPLSLVIDGEAKTVWTTAATVEDALADLGVRADEVNLSVSRSASVDRLSDAVTVLTPKAITIKADGVTLDTSTTAATIGEALTQAGVSLGADDVVYPVTTAEAWDGAAITVTRAQVTSGTVSEVLPFEHVEQDDSSMYKGESKVIQEGQAGEHLVTYEITTAGGQEVSRTVTMDVIVAEPVDEIVAIGTKAKPVVAAAPSVNVNVDPGSAQGIAKQMMLDSYGWGDDEFACLVALWNRESGWRVNAANKYSGAYGIPQALPGSKMASAGADWQTNPATQIAWGLGYIKGRYSTPCGAWGAFQSKGWY